MIKPLTDGMYLDEQGNIFKITSYNEELGLEHPDFPSISVKYLGKDIKYHEHLITMNTFLNMNLKYLGQNENSAWILYGNNIGLEIKYEPNSIDLSSITSRRWSTSKADKSSSN